MNSHRCCFTGHRPEKLNISENEAKIRLHIAIRQAIADGYTTFISGMARGIDMWAAEIVLEEKENNDSITLVCAPPYEGFQNRWNEHERNLYDTIINLADVVKFICPHYSRGCFQIRNCYMVDRSSRVIAAYNEESGGTRNTINYALNKGVKVINIL